MQIIYISKNPKVLNHTLRLVQTFMPFIHEAVIISPEIYQKDIDVSLNLTIRYITDESLVTQEVRQTFDHSMLNYFLRSKAIELDIIDNEFIMSDDDYRPLRPVPFSVFKKDDQYNPYYFYNLDKWKYVKTSFDKCQQNTNLALKESNMLTLAFASHMPQIINKNIFLQSVVHFQKYSDHKSICEWSSYFNFAMTLYPDLFKKPLPYISICWPDYPNIWPPYVSTGPIYFENYYSHLYNSNDLFSGISENTDIDNYVSMLESKLNRIDNYEKGKFLPYLTHRSYVVQYLIKVANLFPRFTRSGLLSVYHYLRD